MVTRRIIHAFCQKVKTLTGKGGNPRQLKVKAQPTRHIVGGFQKDVLLLPEGEMVRAEQQKDLSTLTGTKRPRGILLGAAGDRRGREISPIAEKSPESLKETPDFGGLLGQRGGDDGHGAAPHRQVPVGPPAFLLRGASKLPRHQGFAPLRKTLDRAERRAPGVGGGLLHSRKSPEFLKETPDFGGPVRPARR